MKQRAFYEATMGSSSGRKLGARGREKEARIKKEDGRGKERDSEREREGQWEQMKKRTPEGMSSNATKMRRYFS